MPDTPPRIILASQSPRRKLLLEEAGYDFEVMPSNVDEPGGICTNCGPAEFVSRFATQKTADVVARLKQEGRLEEIAASDRPHVVIGCDTVGEVGGRILGKPADRDEAREMLTMLSDTEHRVYSGLCIWPLVTGNSAASANQEPPVNLDPIVDVDITTLRMQPLEGDELEEYLDTELWEGKAAALGFQDRPGWIHLVRGSGSNVVGLPMEMLERMLAQVNTGEGESQG